MILDYRLTIRTNYHIYTQKCMRVRTQVHREELRKCDEGVNLGKSELVCSVECQPNLPDLSAGLSFLPPSRSLA